MHRNQLFQNSTSCSKVEMLTLRNGRLSALDPIVNLWQPFRKEWVATLRSGDTISKLKGRLSGNNETLNVLTWIIKINGNSEEGILLISAWWKAVNKKLTLGETETVETGFFSCLFVYIVVVYTIPYWFEWHNRAHSHASNFCYPLPPLRFRCKTYPAAQI